MSQRIINILSKEGPMISGELAEKLNKGYDMTPEAARKAISRASSPIHKLKLNFNNNQKFIYLKRHYNQTVYYESLEISLKKHSKAFYNFLRAVMYHNGFIDIKQLPAYSCSPIELLKGHKLAKIIISSLIANNILQEYTPGIYQINRRIYDKENYNKFKAVETAKKVIMDDFENWARRINLVSYNKSKKLDDSPEFYKFQWSFTSPSYVQGIKKRESPGFVIADILIGRPLELSDIDYFMDKINILKQNKNVSSFVPILIVEGLREDTFKKLKAEGVILGLIDRLFGQEYLKTLRSLMTVIENASAIISKSPEKYHDLINKLSKLEGRSSNLRGEVFELAVGYHYSRIAQYIEINKKITIAGKTKEIDVFVKYSSTELRIVECKGHNYPLDEDFIRRWLSKNIKIIREWALHQDDYRHKELVFELWATSGFEKTAEALLEKQLKKTKKYKIVYLDRTKIFEEAKKHANDNLKMILKNFFYEDLLKV